MTGFWEAELFSEQFCVSLATCLKLKSYTSNHNAKLPPAEFCSAQLSSNQFHECYHAGFPSNSIIFPVILRHLFQQLSMLHISAVEIIEN